MLSFTLKVNPPLIPYLISILIICSGICVEDVPDKLYIYLPQPLINHFKGYKTKFIVLLSDNLAEFHVSFSNAIS